MSERGFRCAILHEILRRFYPLADGAELHSQVRRGRRAIVLRAVADKLHPSGALDPMEQEIDPGLLVSITGEKTDWE